MGRKRIFKDDAARQAAHRAGLKKEQILLKREGDYSTPQDLFEEYDRIWHFDTDVCATSANAKCPHYFTPEQDGLQQPWSGTCWMNPPYHQAEIHKWIRKAYAEARRGAVVVALLPVRAGSAWYHEFVLPHAQVTFLRGRIKFAGMTTNAMEDSMIAIFGAPCSQAPAPCTCPCTRIDWAALAHDAKQLHAYMQQVQTQDETVRYMQFYLLRFAALLARATER